MELTRHDTHVLKGMAILLMINLHLFARKEIDGLYVSAYLLRDVPIEYYIGLLGDACRPIYLFSTGYAFYIIYQKNAATFIIKNMQRLFKLAINFWIVLSLFVFIGFLMGKSTQFPGSVGTFLSNFFFLSNSYNGAWWFLQIYIIIVLLAPILIPIVKRMNMYMLISLSGVIYFVCYVQLYKNIIDVSHYESMRTVVRTVCLLGTSQFSFIIGAVFAKEKLYTKIYTQFKHLRYINVICSIGIVMLIVFHGIVESAIIGPINGILFICFFSLMNKSVMVEKILTYLSRHSTNLWLTHMFFYSTIFPKVTFFPKYPLLIFIWLIILCLISSHVIKWIYEPMIQIIDQRFPKLMYKKKLKVS